LGNIVFVVCDATSSFWEVEEEEVDKTMMRKRMRKS
jgi:hypothetical protein